MCCNMYILSVPFGFTTIALLVWYIFATHLMIYCIIALEVPAYLLGKVSEDHPREVYSQIRPFEWNGTLRESWTLLFPLNSRYIPLADRDAQD